MAFHLVLQRVPFPTFGAGQTTAVCGGRCPQRDWCESLKPGMSAQKLLGTKYSTKSIQKCMKCLGPRRTMGLSSLSVIISLSTLLWSKDMAEILVFKRRLVGLVNSERTCRGRP